MDEIKEANDCPPIDGGLCVSFHLRGFLHFFEANIPPPQMRAGGRSIENGWGTLQVKLAFFSARRIGAASITAGSRVLYLMH